MGLDLPITNGNHFARQLMEHVESIDKDNNQDKIKDVDNAFIMIMGDSMTIQKMT
jgi:hypothetical protein